MNEMIFYLQRFAYINNSYNNYSVVSGTSGDDNISNGSQYSTILAGAGNDSISNSGARNIIDAGAGNDTVKNSGITHWSSISGGAGNDSIYNEQGNYVTICGGTGDDTIRIKSLYAGNNIIQYSEGDGNDYFINEWDDSNWTLQIGDGTGTYSTQTSGRDIIVTVGNGKITLANAANLSNVNIAGTYSTGGGGSSNSKLITGTEGEDSIENFVEGATINALGGNDSVENSAEKVLIDGDAGNDTIGNDSYGKNATLNGGTGDDYIWNNANALVNGDNGADTISNRDGAAGATVFGGAGNDSILNSSAAKIYGGTGNDTISNTNLGADATLSGGDGDDVMINYDSANVSIDGGAGNDMIWLFNSNDSLTVGGGTGNDTIQGVSITGNILYQYSAGDGNDVIDGFKADSTLSIGGSSYSTTKSGSDIIVTVGDGKISLIGAASLSKVNIAGTKTSTETNSWKLSGTTATYGTSSKTLIKITGVKSLDGISLDGKVVTVAASALNKKKVSITGSGYTLKLADDVSKPTTKKAAWTLNSSTAAYKSSYKTAGYSLASNSKSISYTSATTASTLATVKGAKTKSFTVSGNKITLKNSALNKKVTVSGGYDFNFASDYKKATITGSAKGDTITTNGNNLSVNGGAGDDTLKIFGTATTVKGGDGADVFVFKAGNNVIADYSEEDSISISGTAQVTTGGDDVIFTVGTNKITVTGGADKDISYVDSSGAHTYSDSKDVSINGSGTAVKLLPSYLEDTFNVAAHGKAIQTIDASAVLLDIEITGNKLMNKITGGDGNDTITGGGSNDTLTGGDGSDVFVYNSGDGNDVITDYTEDDIIQFTSGTASVKKSGKNVIFTLGKGKITVTGGASKIITYTDAGGEHTYPEVVKINDAGTKITLLENYMKDAFDVSEYGEGLKTIDAAAVTHDLSVTGNKLANRIIGTGEDDSINGGSGKDTITGGDGNDTITGGKGNDCLKGGNGSDIFIYNSGDGNDVITDYAEEDKIKIASGTAKVTKSGKDVIFTVGSNKITVKGAASKTVTYIDKNGKTNYYPTTPKSAVIFTDDDTTAILRETYSESTYTAGSSIKKIDASAVQRNLSITGNAKANVILGSYENDTIYGGKGNDILQGGSGADVFVYANGDGNDRIVDYAEEDTIKITSGTIKNKKTSGSDVIFTIGSGKITLAGAADKTVSYIEGGKKKTYGNSASNVLEDDNFITGNDLSALVQSKAADFFAVQESLVQKNNLLPSVTYSSKK